MKELEIFRLEYERVLGAGIYEIQSGLSWTGRTKFVPFSCRLVVLTLFIRTHLLENPYIHVKETPNWIQLRPESFWVMCNLSPLCHPTPFLSQWYDVIELDHTERTDGGYQGVGDYISIEK